MATDRPTRMTSPCKDCPDRSIEPVNCHSVCEKYMVYDEWNQFYRSLIAEKRKEDQISAESCIRTNRRRGKKRAEY